LPFTAPDISAHYPAPKSTCQRAQKKLRFAGTKKKHWRLQHFGKNKEQEAKEKYKQDKVQKAAASLQMAVKAQTVVSEPLPPSVVSPPSAPNLTSLLTGHVGQDRETSPAPDISTKVAKPEQQADDAGKSPTKKKTKKSKPTKEY
jgi:hypothetical protein